MSKFLEGEHLSNAIKELLAGRNVRCAVAFWGNEAARSLFSGRNSTRGSRRIICDISMGCTSPYELEQLGAPGNPYLKFIPGLHTKIYMSDAGVIVGSANASSNGIGWWVPAKLLEGGTFHEANSPVWKEVSDWFDMQHEEAPMVDEAALGHARELWDVRSRHVPPNFPPGPVSLLALVRSAPGRLDNTGFVFGTCSHSAKDIEIAKRTAIRQLGPGAKSDISNWSEDNIYTNWPKEDLDKWPRRVILFWKPRQTSPLQMFAHMGHYFVYRGDQGDVFADPPDWRRFANGIGGGLLSKAESQRKDAALAEQVIERFGREVGGKLFPTVGAMKRELEALELLPEVAEDNNWGE